MDGVVAAGRCPDELDPENGMEYIGGRWRGEGGGGGGDCGGGIRVPDDNGVYFGCYGSVTLDKMKVFRAKNGLRRCIIAINLRLHHLRRVVGPDRPDAIPGDFLVIRCS